MEIKIIHGGTEKNPNYEVDLPGHRRGCGCIGCTWYRRGILIPGYGGKPLGVKMINGKWQ